MSALGDNIARTKLAVDCSAMLNTAKVQGSEARYRIGCYHALLLHFCFVIAHFAT